MDSFSTASARRALGSLQAVRWTGDSAGFSNVRMMYAGRTGVCGNGLCEVCPFRHNYEFPFLNFLQSCLQWSP